ncbi:ankyrin repeat-containing domain protein [Xylaria telfairii]|nr:ankyrin repeat-containing domain protein [Xylaria telfairii]
MAWIYFFGFENTLTNLGARLPSPGRTTATNEITLTSKPRHGTSNPLIPDLIPPSFGSSFNSSLPFDCSNIFANLGDGPLSPSRVALRDQIIAGITPAQGPVDYEWLGRCIPHLNSNHTLDDDVQLALIGPGETLPAHQNHLALDLWPQRPYSELQVGTVAPLSIELPVFRKISFNSHFTRFEEFLRAKGVSFTRLGLTGQGSQSPFPGGFNARSIAGMVLSKQKSLTRGPSDLENALGRLETLLPVDSTTLTTKDQALETKFTRILLFSMLNGFAGLDDIPVEDILNFLGRLSITSRSFLTALKECSTHAARTFVDTIFRASIEAKDTHALKQLLEHRLVDVNGTVCFSGSNRYTPIERAAKLQAYSLIETLLHYRADVNKTLGASHAGALTHLMKSFVKDSVTTKASITATVTIIKTVDLIVSAGARPSPSDLEDAVRLFTTSDIACNLSLAIHPSDHRAFFDDSLLHMYTAVRRNFCVSHVIQYLEDSQASKIIRKLIELCETACCGRCLVDFASGLEHAAVKAAKLGYLETVQLLINHIPSLTGILCAAIRSNKKDLIDFVLSFNPDLNPPARYLKTIQHARRTTPLAEAVRAGNEELITYLHSKGAVARLNKGKRLGSLIFAAACSGNISLMRQLLSRADSSSHPYRVPSQAIGITLLNGHEEVARLLLESGAAVQDYRPPFKATPLRIALRSQNKSLVQALLDANITSRIGSGDFDEAFKWDDMSIVTELTSAYYRSPCTSSLKSRTFRKLCERCMQDDNMDFFRNFVDSIRVSTSGFSQERFLPYCLTSCLKQAVIMGHSEMVCYLLDIGTNPFTSQVLRVALSSHSGMLHILFNKRRQRQTIPKCIGARVLSSVMEASLSNPQALGTLLETQAVNLTALESYNLPSIEKPRIVTPLGYALYDLIETPDKDPWMVREFLDAGSDPNGVAKSLKRNTGNDYTGLMLSLKTGRRKIVQLLIDKGADVNLKPRFAVKQTPLQYAAELGDLDIVRMLLEKDADVNAEPAIRSGGSALQFAAISGNCNIVKELLANGALMGALPSRVEGRWPLEGAAEHGRLDMIQFLWNAANTRVGGGVIAGFQRRHCLRAMSFARKNGHMGCMGLISDLSGIPADRLDFENYGAPWLAYSDWNHGSSSSNMDTVFLSGSNEWVGHGNGSDEVDDDGEDEMDIDREGSMDGDSEYETDKDSDIEG